MKRGEPACGAGAAGTGRLARAAGGRREKAFAFYSELFGWQPGARAKTTCLDSYQLVAAGGRTIGGMFTKLPRAPVPFWLYYFEVADIAWRSRG